MTKREINKALKVHYEMHQGSTNGTVAKWTVAEVGTMVSLCADQDVRVSEADEMKKFFEAMFGDIIAREPGMGHPGPNCVNGNTVMTWVRA